MKKEYMYVDCIGREVKDKNNVGIYHIQQEPYEI